MRTELKKCEACDTLFSARQGMRQCDACIKEEMRVRDLVDRAVDNRGLKTAGAIAKHTGVPIEKVKSVIRASRVLSQSTSLEVLCKKCEDRTALKRSDYCALCSLEMHASLRDTVNELNTKISERNARPEARLRSMKVSDIIRQKRGRTGSNHARPDQKPGKG